MDISKQRPKGISSTNISTKILLLLIITPMLLSASNTFYIEEIECQCSGTSAVCRGTSEDEDEIQRLLSTLLQNCSSINDLLDLTLNIEKIETLPNKSFISFKLQNLTLGYGLETLFQDSFDGLQSSLINLNLSHNDIEFYGSPFSMLQNLKELNLDFNNLREQDFSTFGNINKLEVLSIAGNHLSSLRTNFLENMTAIQSLILDQNKNITSFSKINIVSSTLINLSAKNCAIEGSLENDSLSGIANLKHADFSSNKLIRVNAFALDKLHYLEALNLSYNKIETLKDYSFASLHNLIALDLKGNEIKEIEVFSFVNLTKLRILNLADNKLEVIMEKYTSDLYSLEKINLENNEIHIVMPGSFSTCRQLKELLLRGNAFHCDLCDLMYIVGFLTNDTLFKKEDADAITCAAPDEMKGIPLTKVPPESLDEICEPDESTSEMSTTIIPTTEKTITDYTQTTDNSFAHTDDLFSIDVSTLSGETDTSSVTPIITPESTSEVTDSTYETTRLSIISSTAQTPFLTVPGSTEISTEVTTLITESTTGIKEITVSSTSYDIIDVTSELSSKIEKSETSSATDIILPSMPQTTIAKASEITENTSTLTDITSESEMEKNTTTEIIMLAISESNTAGNVGTSAQSTSASTILPTTEITKETTFPNTIEMTTSINKLTSILLPETEGTTISVTVTSTNIATESPLASSGKTDLYEEETSQINTVSTQTDFTSTDMVVYNESTKVFTTALPTKKTSESQMIRIIDSSVSDDKICVKWDMKWKILSKQWIIKELKCNVEIQHSKGKHRRARNFSHTHIKTITTLEEIDMIKST
ncbi:Leucine-rich repeats and immunoglobulin-like [Argiope bruennichi]|uniref:Leucine-rich repeats and immunoglobulin-like n=1 Tax=Argiope bruennichi TaxID=94029 RepID=A0A8T0FUY9_ARGBR|nr:Leucine-rich repeats and immunoglobulin-like [Argiope bruennichi]